MKEYLTASLKPGIYVSFPVRSDEQPDRVVPFFAQVLAIAPRVTLPKMCRSKEEKEKFLDLSLQPLERCSPDIAVDDPDPAALTSAEVFIFHEPSSFDWGQCTAEDRRKFLQWESEEESEVDGCISLRRPKIVEPRFWTLSDRDIPALCLLDLLKDDGWTARSELAHHSVESEKVFDDRNPIGKKHYLRCVLCCNSLYSCDIEFPSGRSNAFYEYLLKFHRLPVPGKSAKQLRKEIADAGGDDEADDLVALEEPLPLPPKRPRPAPAVADCLDSDVALEPDDIVPLEDVQPGAPVPEPIPEPVPEPAAAIANEPPAPAEGAPVAHDVEWPAELDGQRLIKVAGRAGGSHSYAARLKVCCPNADHLHCAKSRSVKMQTSELGAKAPLYFLGAWMEASDKSEADHQAHVPSLADQEEYKARYDARG